MNEKNVNATRQVPSIEESIPEVDPKNYPSVTQRYYTPLYYLDSDRETHEDLLVLLHSNRICLVSLAPSHPVIQQQLTLKTVNLEVSRNVDRKSNRAVGKSKKGGQILEPISTLAILETEEGQNFSVKAVVPGKLITINKELLANPGLAASHHDSHGHIAIILPSWGLFQGVKSSLLTEEEYREKIKSERE